MDRAQRLQQQDDDGDSSSSSSFSSSSSSSSSQPIDDSDGYISDEDYVDHDEEVIINKSLKEVMTDGFILWVDYYLVAVEVTGAVKYCVSS